MMSPRRTCSCSPWSQAASSSHTERRRVLSRREIMKATQARHETGQRLWFDKTYRPGGECFVNASLAIGKAQSGQTSRDHRIQQPKSWSYRD